MSQDLFFKRFGTIRTATIVNQSIETNFQGGYKGQSAEADLVGP